MTGRSPNDAAHWSDESLSYDVLHERAATIARVAANRRPASVLELGCSTGKLRAEFGRLCPEADYYATDISEVALREVADATTACTDLNNDSIPFEGTNFDCIAGSGVLEYIDDVSSLLSSCRNRLRPDGRLVVSYVNRRALRRRALRLAGRATGDHTWRPLISPHELLESARRANLELITVRGLRGHIQHVSADQPMSPSHSRLGRVLAWRSPQLVFEFAATSTPPG